jgi:hypothetical protein
MVYATSSHADLSLYHSLYQNLSRNFVCVYMHVCVCVCVCVRARARVRTCVSEYALLYTRVEYIITTPQVTIAKTDKNTQM